MLWKNSDSGLDDSCVLLTGASGFLGREIVRQATAHRMRIRAVSRQRTEFPAGGFTTSKVGDVTDAAAWVSLCAGVKTVIHAAGLAHQFGRASANSDFFDLVNRDGTENVLRGAAAAGVMHAVLISSVSVYGGGATVRNETSPCLAKDPYGASKRKAEEVALKIAEKKGMRLTILRLATLYGESDPGNIGRLMGVIDRRRFVWIGAGRNQKSLIHVSDAARACLLTALAEPPPTSVIYNVSAPPVEVRAIVQTLARGLERSLPTWRIPGRLAHTLSGALSKCARGASLPARVHRTISKWLADDVYDAERFSTDFSFRPRVSLEEGLIKQANSYRGRQAA